MEKFITCWCTNNEKRRILAFVRMSDTDMAELDYSQEGLCIDKYNESIGDLMLEIYDTSFNSENINSILKNKDKFKAFDKVLVRNSTKQVWRAAIFSHFNKDIAFPYIVTDKEYKYCIPYNEITKQLIGTRNDYTV